MTDNVPFCSGEVTLWEGRPGQGIRYSVFHLIYAFVGVYMLVFAVSAFSAVLNGDWSKAPALFLGMTLVATVMLMHGLFFLIGVPYLDRQHRALTQYKLTDQRAIIIDSSAISTVFIRELNADWRVSHFPKAGSVLLRARLGSEAALKRLPIATDQRFNKIIRYLLWYTQILNISGFRFVDDSKAIERIVRGALQDAGQPTYK